MIKRITVAVLMLSLTLSTTAQTLEDNPQRRAEEAMSFFREGDFESALHILRPLAAAYPGSVDAHFLLGLAAAGAADAVAEDAPQWAELLEESAVAFLRILNIAPGLTRVRLELARVHFKQKKFDDALTLLRPLVARLPADIDAVAARFLLGRAAVAAAEMEAEESPQQVALLDEAIAAFHAILVDNPDLVRVRLELARAFFIKKEDDLADREFDRVLAGDLPPQVVANIRGFILSIRARRRWSAYFSFAIVPSPDTEETVSEGCVRGFNCGFTNSPDEADLGVSFSGGFSYQLPIINKDWRLDNGIDFFHSEHRNSDSDQTIISANSGPRWLLGANSEIGLSPKFSVRWIAGQEYSRDLGADISASHRFSRRFSMSGRFSYLDRTHNCGNEDIDCTGNVPTGRLFCPPTVDGVSTGYRRRPVSNTGNIGVCRPRDSLMPDDDVANVDLIIEETTGRIQYVSDGARTSASLSGNYLLTPTIQTWLSLGWSQSRPKRGRLGDNGQSINGGASFALPNGWTLGGSVGYSQTKHKDPPQFAITECGVFCEDKQEDKSRTFRVSILPRAWTIFGFSPQLSLVYEKQESNSVQNNSVDKRGELKFVQQF